MKNLKIRVIVFLLFGSLTAFVNEEMDDDMLVAPDNVESRIPILVGGAIDEL
ncbi:hypothetical protein ACFFVB_01020 [Formosa undariae]|uniref:Uncharacterized protein n=1 Tax=Formosa undariae TaxID=1325436 RepID=A0ABV5EWT8_9FLAO